MALKSTSTDTAPDLAAPLTAPRVTPIPYLATTVGKKVVMAVTGLLLGLYLVLHLAGNYLLFFGPPTFNAYSHFLIANPLIVPVEIGLLATFLIHIYEAALNWWVNRQARPVGYYQPIRRYFGYGWAGWPSRKSIASTTMIVSGAIIIVFVIIHLLQFKFGPEYTVTSTASGTVGERDLYRLEIENFSNALIVGFYALCMVVIGFHLWHGISSALNSLGADDPRSTPTILRICRVLAVVLAGGFLFIPVWVFFFRG
jgi:succinate dehydrogenase / fumarate reductase, cytochrome b subunit